MLTIDNPKSKSSRMPALLQLGFRPFFLLASVYAVLSILLWAGIYFGKISLPAGNGLQSSYWHAHEMLYGYVLAVIAGFLLTAVKNWTGIQTIQGKGLLLLALLWLLARPLPFVSSSWALPMMAALELFFISWLCWELAVPVIRVRQWQQLGIIAKVVLLLIGNGLFYLGLFGILENGMRWGLYTGLYTVLSLVLLMGRRVIPFFIEKGVGYPVRLVNHKWVDRGSVVLIVLLWISDVFLNANDVVLVSSGLLFLLHAFRMDGWYTTGVWKKPLLWVLYIAYGWIVIGFGLKAIAAYGLINPMLSLHAFAYGGIAMVTIGMMARVAYGHTGRDVFNPPKILLLIFLILALGAVTRVVFPVFWPVLYLELVFLSQLFWIISFGLFVFSYFPVFTRPRIDGRPG